MRWPHRISPQLAFPYFSRTRRRQHEELEGQFVKGVGGGLSHFGQGPTHLAVVQGRMVIWFPIGLGQGLAKGFSCRVIEAVSVGNHPVHDGLDSLLDPAGGFGLAGPDGLHSTFSTSFGVIWSTGFFAITG